MTTPLVGLAALVAKAQATVQQKDALKKAEGNLKAAPNAARRAQALEEVQSLQSALDWLPSAIVFKLEKWHCLCDRHGTTPLGIFIQQKHVRMANSTRLIRPHSNDLSGYNALPRFTQRVELTVLMCGVCSVTEHRFGLELPVPAPLALQQRVVRGEFTKEWEKLTAPIVEDETTEEPQDGDEDDSDL